MRDEGKLGRRALTAKIAALEERLRLLEQRLAVLDLSRIVTFPLPQPPIQPLTPWTPDHPMFPVTDGRGIEVTCGGDP